MKETLFQLTEESYFEVYSPMADWQMNSQLAVLKFKSNNIDVYENLDYISFPKLLTV